MHPLWALHGTALRNNFFRQEFFNQRTNAKLRLATSETLLKFIYMEMSRCKKIFLAERIKRVRSTVKWGVEWVGCVNRVIKGD